VRVTGLPAATSWGQLVKARGSAARPRVMKEAEMARTLEKCILAKKSEWNGIGMLMKVSY